MTASAPVFIKHGLPSGKHWGLIEQEFSMTEGTGILHEVFVEDGGIPVLDRSVGVLHGSSQSLSAVADRTAKFVIRMKGCRMCLQGLRRIVKSWIVNPEVASLAAVRPIQIAYPLLPDSEPNLSAGFAAFLSHEIAEFFLVFAVGAIVVPPELGKKQQKNQNAHNYEQFSKDTVHFRFCHFHLCSVRRKPAF
jgi:hypothetical protein